mgnify:CR=1 FL=1
MPVRTVILAFQKPTFYVVARPEIKSAADLKGQDDRHQLPSAATPICPMKIYAGERKLDPDRDIETHRRGFDVNASPRTQGRLI